MANLHINFRSDCISRSVYPTVFLPDLNMWRDIEPPYPTLYFLSGYSGGGLETAMFSNFALFAMRYGVAVVLTDGENSFYTDDEQRQANFSQYVGNELVEVTRSVLPLSRRREDTFIGGISMGGYGSLINGLRFSGNFSKIAMLSPALGFKRLDDEANPKSPSPKGELLATLDGPAYLERVTVNSVKNVNKAKKAIKKAFQNQIDGKGFSFVEVLSACPTNWGMTPQKALQWIDEAMIPQYPLGVFRDKEA